MIYTDDFGRGHFVLRAGPDGLRITSNNDSKNLAHFDARGNIVTALGNFEQTIKDVQALKPVPPPNTSKDACTHGTWAADADYVYVCVATNNWKRTALSSW